MWDKLNPSLVFIGDSKIPPRGPNKKFKLQKKSVFVYVRLNIEIIIIIGIKHDFLCINICWAPSTSWRAQQMFKYQKSMFDRYYCIKTFFRSKTLEKLLQKVLFSCTYNGTEKHVSCERFENATSRVKTNFITTVHVTGDDVSFMRALECLFIKPQSCALTARELPC